jgi:ATP-dependent helicase Lhr and Lhr-like helicase
MRPPGLAGARAVPYLSPMEETSAGSLELFHPVVRQWFLRSVGKPTEVQERAWPEIAKGSHVLVSAPTGTGKTLTAFLWGLNQLATGALSPGKVRMLYISPLKALNNDIQRNLLAPLAALSLAFQDAGLVLPQIKVLTRSGDTPYPERQRMVRHPPEILITTPESLNLILSSPNSRLMLDGLATVVLDEIHAVAASKRGTHLVSAVDRLVGLAGEVQRIALSATVKPLSAVADLVGGYIMDRAPDGEAVYRKRHVKIIHCPMAKVYDIGISFPSARAAAASAVAPSGASAATDGAAGAVARPAGAPDDPVFDAVARECRRIIAENRSTLFFVNSRRHAEKLARFINEGQKETLAWSHHGSLSRELRFVVEQRLKRGELKAIVATSSLELGIDVGALDRVILVQTPFTVSSTVQRLGRAGHKVGETSRGTLFPLHGKDIVDAAVTAQCVREQDIEEISPVLCPLDVLAQVIVSMTMVETWNASELYDRLRTSFPFYDLPRRQFDLVLEMLAGKYKESRLRDLAPLVSYDRLEATVRAKDSARMRLMMGGGTIPDRGYFSLRAADSKALIGDLDEEFVWERSLGDSFVFGTQGWRIQKIDHQNVEVVPVPTRIGMSPFWKAEGRNRDFHLSDRIARALEEWNGKLSEKDFPAALEKTYGLDPDAAGALVAFLSRQQEASGAELPHRHHLLVEHTRDPDGKPDGANVILHTLWGGRVNRPFSLALSAAWEERYGYRPEMFQSDDAILLYLPEDKSASEILPLVDPGSLERLLRKRLEGSGFFGARFRESAGRALLLPRAAARARTPLWLTRQRAKTLYAAVSRYDDFPMLLEAWRVCLRDEFDLGSLAMLLEELRDGAIRVGEVATHAPSPFCGELLWKQTNSLMYADDAPEGSGGTSLRGDLVREVALTPGLRPLIAADAAVAFQGKLQRTAEGYAPRDARELLDWLKERILLPRGEWEALLAACARDFGLERKELEAALAAKIVERSFGDDAARCIVALEVLPRIERSLASQEEEALAELLAEWLRFYGPLDPAVPRGLFALSEERWDSLLSDLVEQELVVADRLVAGALETQICDRENLESLLRISRARARPAFSALPAERLALFVARHQGLAGTRGPAADIRASLEKLFGFPLPAATWEEEALPARTSGYASRMLDSLLAESPLLWLGCGKGKLTFCLEQDVELFKDRLADDEETASLFPAPSGRYSFWDLLDHTRLPSPELTARLWAQAWKGRVANESFQIVRRGIETGFQAEEPARTEGRGRRSFDRWQASRPLAGLWFRVESAGAARDALDEEEIARDRIRQVLQRYPVVFREVLEPELPALRWSRLFRSLRFMELAGEVVSGRFFEGIHGLQFALPSVLEELAVPPSDEVYWMNATDPASLCGVPIEALKGTLPSRLPSTHVVFQGGAVALVSRRKGLDLEFRVDADSPRIPEILSFVKVLTGRGARPMNVFRVETINGRSAGESPYAERLREFGFVEDYRRLVYRATV